MKTQVVEAFYTYYDDQNPPHEAIIFTTYEDAWWIEIMKYDDGNVRIRRTERDPFGRLHRFPDIPDIREYDSEEGRFQLSLIWEEELDMNFIMQCQLQLFPLLGTHQYDDDIQFTVQY